MNMVMESSQAQITDNAPIKSLQISTTPPTPPNDESSAENNAVSQLSRKPTNAACAKNTLKRSFDVAFLMMPDERLKHNQSENKRPVPPAQLQSQEQFYSQMYKQEFNVRPELRRYPQIMVRTPRVYDDPTVVISPTNWESSPLKSAFTKVTSRLESPGEPAPSLSPDQLSCSSMSPPVATTPPRSASGSSSDIISIDNMMPSPAPSIVGYQNFRPDYPPNGAFQSVQAFHSQRLKHQLLYRAPVLIPDHSAGPSTSPPDFLPAYPGFSFPPTASGLAHPFAAVPQPELPRIVQNPAAAAILSTLIPPTLASTFTLTAQNVCAKCNISFRMTSDLVYHMRSHHKSEVSADPNRRKREEKLKCPVCQESFRERHHLTRHMTAHQDKESDQTSSTPSTPTGASSHNCTANHNGRLSSTRNTTFTK